MDERVCDTCKHASKTNGQYPCSACKHGEKWEGEHGDDD